MAKEEKKQLKYQLLLLKTPFSMHFVFLIKAVGGSISINLQHKHPCSKGGQPLKPLLTNLLVKFIVYCD